jgi:hypothetical protein
MKTVIGDIWEFAKNGEVICIPTNGYLTKHGIGVMGKGLALQAKHRYPDIPINLGRHLQTRGNTVGWILLHPIRIIAVPVKPIRMILSHESDRSKIIDSVRLMYAIGSAVPGFHCKADPKIIRQSLNELLMFMIKNSLNSVMLPLLGCGAGGLDYKKDLLPILNEYELPDSITLVIPPENLND